MNNTGALLVAGSIKLKTGPPSNRKTWIGLQPSYQTGSKAPALPSICVHIAVRHAAAAAATAAAAAARVCLGLLLSH